MQTNIASIDDLKVVNALKVLKPVMTNPLAKTSLRLLAIFGERGSAVIYVTTDDQYYGYGDNRYGCLGVCSDEKHIPEPTLSPALTGKHVVNVFYGFGHCLALTPSGQVYAWGENDFGQLGLGTFDTTSTPTLITTLSRVADIACGNRHTLALTTDGLLFGWGRNTFGAVGDQTYCWRVSPTRVHVCNEKIASISCGKCHSLAVTESGILYVWGLNDFGQLGRHRDNDLRLGKERALSNRPELIRGFESTVMKRAVCGPNTTMFLTVDGLLYACGHNDWGQIGNGTLDTQWAPVLINSGKGKLKDIVTTYDNNLVIAVGTNDKFYVWGYPYYNRKIMRPSVADIQPPEYSIFDAYVKYSGSFRTYKTIVFNEEVNGNQEVNGNVPKHCSVARNNHLNPYNGATDGNDSGHESDSTTNPFNSSMMASNRSLDMSPMDVFNRHLSYAFNNRSNYDLVFLFEHEMIYCHKTILRIRNKKFWDICDNYLFNNSNVMDNALIRIKSHSYEAYYAFIQFLYGLQPDINGSNKSDVTKLAALYGEPVLLEMCGDAVVEEEEVGGQASADEVTIDLSNFCSLYEKAVKDDLFDLEKRCIEFALNSNNLIEIIKSDTFHSLPQYLSKRFMLEVYK